MRDFQLLPQYDYCCDPWRVGDVGDGNDNGNGDGAGDRTSDIDRAVDGSTHIFSTTNVSSISLPSVLVAYGSETGTAEAAATCLARRLKLCRPSLMSLNEVCELERERLISCTHILIICSTFGAGEPPSNATNFFTADLVGKITNSTSFAVLALGSSLYPDFCEAGKAAHDKMEALGARSMINVSFADASQGNQSERMLEWSSLVEKLILPSSLLAQIDRANALEGESLKPPLYRMKWSTVKEKEGQETPSLNESPLNGTVRCVKNVEMFEDGDINERSTRHIELQLPSGGGYGTGDHFSVAPMNAMSMVMRFCYCFESELEATATKLGFHGLELNEIWQQSLQDFSLLNGCKNSLAWQIHQPFVIESIENGESALLHSQHLTNNSLLDVLRLHVDFSFFSEIYLLDLLSMLSAKLEEASASDVSTRKKMTSSAIMLYKEFMELKEESSVTKITTHFHTIIDFLENFNELFCIPLHAMAQPILSLADVLNLMPGLKPRLYSVSTSDTASPDIVSLTVGVVNRRGYGGALVKGVCSHYLANLEVGDTVKGKVIRSTFKPPESISFPTIMICAGTGLAPFIGFLQDRDLATKHDYHKEKARNSHLFFGCRTEKEMTYKNQLLKWSSEGLMQLHVAHSRQSGTPSMHVQDCLVDDGEKLAALLTSNQNTHVYICGDARMAKSCLDKCIELLQKYGGMSKLAATLFISNMRLQSRWQLDVWGESDDEGIVYDFEPSQQLEEEAKKVLSMDFATSMRDLRMSMATTVSDFEN